MKREFFHIPLFVYKADTAAGGGTPEAPKTPEAPPSSDITRDNADAEKNLKNAAQSPDTPPKPKTENQDDINKVVPATGEEDRRDFRVHAKPAARNTAPRPRLKFNAAGERVDTPPPTTNAPTTGSHEKPPETPTSDTPKPPEKPRDPDREYHTYHRADGSKETVSRRNGGAWRTASSDGKRERIILGQDQNIHPETPIQPSKNTAPAKALQTPPPSTPKQTPPAPSKDKQSPPEGVKVSDPAQKTPATPERRAIKGIGPIESTGELHQPISPENKESPKTATPEKDQKTKTYEEENADFQKRFDGGEYDGSPAAFKAGLEHAERVEALRSGTETKKETKTPPLTEAENIPTSKPEESQTTKGLSESDATAKKGILAPSTTEKPKPGEAENVPTTDAPLSTGDTKETPAQPSSATEASKIPPPTKNKPPLPVDTEQSNEAVITVNGKSIPLTRESPDAAWRDRDGVPYGDALVAGSMKKDNAEKTQETKTASVPAKPPVPETPTAQPNTPVNPPESDKKDTKKPPESNTPPPTEPVPRDAEEAKYLQKEKDFKKNLDSGKYTQYNTQKGREEFTPEGRKAFRELTSSDHRYIPGAIFSRASDSFFKVPGAAGELHDRGEENSFLKNRAQQRELAQTPSETTIVRAERHKSSKSKNDITNGGENAFNMDMSKGVVSGDDPDLSAERWRTYDYNTMKQGGYPRLTVFSQERDILGKPQFAAKVMHPNDPKTKELEERIAEGGQFPNLYTAEMDVFGNGKPQKVYLMPNELIPNSLSLGDGPASPSKISVLKEKKPEEKKEEPKPPKLPEIPYS